MSQIKKESGAMPKIGNVLACFLSDVVQLPIKWDRKNSCATGEGVRKVDIGGMVIDAKIRVCTDFLDENSLGALIQLFDKITLYIHARSGDSGNAKIPYSLGAGLYVVEYSPSFIDGICEMVGHDWDEVKLFLKNKVRSSFRWDNSKRVWEKTDVLDLE